MAFSICSNAGKLVTFLEEDGAFERVMLKIAGLDYCAYTKIQGARLARLARLFEESERSHTLILSLNTQLNMYNIVAALLSQSVPQCVHENTKHLHRNVEQGEGRRPQFQAIIYQDVAVLSQILGVLSNSLHTCETLYICYHKEDV